MPKSGRQPYRWAEANVDAVDRPSTQPSPGGGPIGKEHTMKKLVPILLSLGLTLGFAFTTAHAAEPPAKPVKIETAGAKKAPVLFDHKKHSEVKCETCHHKEHNDAGERLCVKCHKIEDDAATKAPRIEMAMHGNNDKVQGKCFGCHRATDAKHKLKCADCHKG
jgi:hypothetical protein